MDNRRKAALFAVMAVIMAVVSSIYAANDTIRHVFIVVPLVVMGVLLFLAGYFAGLARR